MSKNYKLLKVDKVNPRKVIFYFEHEKGIEDTISQYFNSEIKLDPKIVFINLKGLKNMIHNSY